MPRRIVISANTSWYLFNFRSNLIRTLQQAGYEIIAVAPRDAYSTRLPCTFEHIHIDQGGTNPLTDIRTTLNFYRLFRRLKPAIVLNFTPKNNIYGTLAARQLKIPVINNIAGLGSVFIEEGVTARIARWLYRISQPYASTVFFQNEEDRQLMLKAGYVNKWQAKRLPGSGVDLEHFKPIPKLPRAPGEEDNIVFILMGRMLYEKGIAEYVDAARRVRALYPHTEFRLLGFIDQRNPSAIPAQVIKDWHASGDIRYRGSSDNVREELAAVNCVVLPSYYREGVPRSLLEGAAMGKPLVTTDNVGCRETVDEGINGYLCPPQDSEALAEVLIRIITLPEAKRNDMGRASRKLVKERFDERVIENAYLEAVNADQEHNKARKKNIY